jgi:hypothetical protein
MFSDLPDFWTDVTRLFAVPCSIGPPKYSSIFPFAHSFLSSWFFRHHCFHRVVAWSLLSSVRHEARSLKFYTYRRSRTSDVESLSLFQKICIAINLSCWICSEGWLEEAWVANERTTIVLSQIQRERICNMMSRCFMSYNCYHLLQGDLGDSGKVVLYSHIRARD